MAIRTHPIDLGFAYNPWRKQYNSLRLLPRLHRYKRAPGDMIMGVVDVDIYSPGYEFIYGEAEIAVGAATLSVYRLKSGTPEVVLERTIKEATHELGHLYGLGHCPNPECVMLFCTNIEDVDRKKMVFCPNCREQLRTQRLP